MVTTNSSFFIPAKKHKANCSRRCCSRALKISDKIRAIKKKKLRCGALWSGTSTGTGYNGQAEFRWLMLVHANRGGGECNNKITDIKTPLTFFFQPLSKSFIWMRD